MHRSIRASFLALIGCFCALVLVPSLASAAFVDLGPAADFNVFVFNDNTQSGSDAEGAVAVGGDALLGSFTIASSLSPTTTNLVVGGNLSNSATTFNGGLLADGNVNWHNPTIQGAIAVNGDATFTGDGTLVGPVTVAGTYTAPGYFPHPPIVATTPLPFDFAAVANYLTDMADHLASLPMNGTTTIMFGGITLNGSDAAFNNCYITAADLAAGTGLTINAPAGSTVVLNVDGAAADFDNQQIFLNGVNEHYVLYNFHSATTLGISGIGVRGSLLAPRADVNFGSGNIDGTLIANNLTGPGESHLFPFEGELPPIVPEPSTAALVAMLGALATLARRRRLAS
jgi:choice-of-anchor A domain-containing protein